MCKNMCKNKSKMEVCAATLHTYTYTQHTYITSEEKSQAAERKLSRTIKFTFEKRTHTIYPIQCDADEIFSREINIPK